ncbi:MAG TPA: putative sulfate exporter family transporter [Marmoricola sp.]|jgi:uncharacterized integral membrane protein (TIGR00698 family)|nr:putative sulfate exporter family transporter [Marmoricola sp.]
MPAATRRLLPGLALSAAAAVAALASSSLAPFVSPLLVAILLGVALAAVRPLPESVRPGLAFSGRTLLRLGVVLLGLQLSLREIADLGAGAVVLVLAVVVGGITGTLWIGGRLGIPWTQRLLIACGFSICGAAAVAAVDGAVDADEEEVATAVALVVVFGTTMIAVVPLLVAVLGIGTEPAGLWAGASIHEVAQVVAAGGIIGGGALGVAVVVKLARVLMLAPVLAWAGWQRRRRLAVQDPTGALPPLVPGFVVGFVALVLVHTWLPVPTAVTGVAGVAETALLAAAMFALGCGVRVGDLRRTGARPVLLATLATGWVGAIGLCGTLLLSH